MVPKKSGILGLVLGSLNEAFLAMAPWTPSVLAALGGTLAKKLARPCNPQLYQFTTQTKPSADTGLCGST